MPQLRRTRRKQVLYNFTCKQINKTIFQIIPHEFGHVWHDYSKLLVQAGSWQIDRVSMLSYVTATVLQQVGGCDLNGLRCNGFRLPCAMELRLKWF